MKTIFVQIPSYRDPECQWTVKDIFLKAKHPQRIHVGICWQYDPKLDADCFKETGNEEQVRINPFHFEESEGVCWARHQAQQLYDGEDYVLSIDSHMRFAPHWDEKLIRQLDECPSLKAILSNHPAAYTPPDNLQTDAVPNVLTAKPYTPEGDLRIRGATLNRAPDNPLKGAFCSAGLLFAKGDFIREIPYDPYMYFDQEEISLSARLYTHGFDVFSLRNTLLYHYYRSASPGKDEQPPMHWDDNPRWMQFQERARKRLDHLFGHTPSEDPEIIRDMEKHGIGTARDLAQYQEFCGIDFKKRVVGVRALNGGFIEHLDTYLNPPVNRSPQKGQKNKGVKAALKMNRQEVTSLPFQPFDQSAAIARLKHEHPEGGKLHVDNDAPEGILIVYDYISLESCAMLTQYADAQTFTNLEVVDHENSTNDKVATVPNDGRITNHVDIDGRAHDILTLFNDIHCRCMAPFYDVNFEWYERPQILRYPAGGKYNQHADADHWVAEKNEWIRVQDRDYSVLLYLNDAYEGGELELVNQKFKIKPKPGMMLAFPSDYRYLHAALPTTSGIRYVIVSWAAVMGSRRVRPQMPHASIYIRQKRGI